MVVTTRGVAGLARDGAVGDAGPAGAISLTVGTSETIRVLAIDDELPFLRGLSRLLNARGFEVLPFSDPERALVALAADKSRIDVVMIDRSIGAVDGFDVLARAHAIAADVPGIILTGDHTDSTAAGALRAGAFHFLTKPIDHDALALTLLRAGHYRRLDRRARALERRIGLSEQFETLVGASAPMRALFILMAKIADSDLGVLIEGESGTGKELAARAIHDRSPRAKGPFVALNCGALPESLIDSELFGHARGAFTGATEARPGVFLEADGGTLFLDEIAELSLAVQTRLLRVLQEREVRSIGGTGTRVVDVRVLAATHVDLAERIEQKLFRADLYYRLNVAKMTIPPLRQRIEDIPLLVHHLVAKHAARQQREVPTLAPRLVAALTSYPWPGNVRELENVVQCALAMSRSDRMDIDALPPQFTATARVTPPDATGEMSVATPPAVEEHPLRGRYQVERQQSLESFDRAYFTQLVARTGGNLSEASRLSGVDRSNLRRTLDRLGLRIPLVGALVPT